MTNRPRPRPGRWGWRLFLTLFTVYTLGGFYFGYSFFTKINAVLYEPVRAASAAGPDETPPDANYPRPPNPPGIIPSGSAPTPVTVTRAAQPTPAPAAAGGPPRRAAKINVLLMGLDQREDTIEWDPGRTDTMILATIDPEGRSVTLLSIPRDLWVVIPSNRFGRISEKITGAHTYGGLEKYPTGDNELGGPELARKTVELNFGVPVHFWARVDLKGFEEAVDKLGGVWVDVEKEIYDTEYPTEDYGTMTIYIPAGRQLMDGKTALQYARSRHSGNDIERGARQRQVLLAVRQQAMSLDVIRSLPEFANIFQDHFVTNMSTEDMIKLALIVRNNVPPENVKSRAIDARYVREFRTETGAEALLPDRSAIGELMREIYYADNALKADGARILVRNGAGVEGFAAAWTRFLNGRDFQVVRFDSAERNDYQRTVIIDRTPEKNKRYTLQMLRVALGNLDESRVRREPQPGGDVDIEIILGADAPAR